MRKEAKEFRLKSKVPPTKSNSMRFPAESESEKLNLVDPSKPNNISELQDSGPMFDYNKFQKDLKSDSTLQKVYMQFIQAYKEGNLLKPHQGAKGPMKPQKGKKKGVHKGLTSQSYTQANTQEGPRNTSDKTEGKQFGERKKSKKHQASEGRNSGRKNHSMTNSPQR